MRAPTDHHVGDFDPGARLFGHQVPQPLLSILDHIAAILGDSAALAEIPH